MLAAALEMRPAAAAKRVVAAIDSFFCVQGWATSIHAFIARRSSAIQTRL